MVSASMLKELFTAPLLTLPGSEAANGVPPVIEARVDLGGKFAFVEFRDEELATTALSLFNSMELCGRAMQVARPTGYMGPGGPGGPTAPFGGPPPPPPMPGQLPPGFAAAGAAGAAALPPGLVPPPPPAAPPPPPATRFLRLENLLGDEALSDDAEYAECVEDIRGECETFGTVKSAVFPRQGDLHGYTEAEIGSCFITFETISAAVKAQADLNGREFDNKKVIARFIPPSTG